MTHYYQNVRGAFTFPKLYYSMVSMFDNAEFAEIGCDCGQSSCFIGVEIINQNKNIKLNLIDTWGDADLSNPNGYDSYDLFRKNIQPVKDKLDDKINIIKDYDNQKKDKVKWLKKTHGLYPVQISNWRKQV